MALHRSVIAYRSELEKLLPSGKKRCTKCQDVREIKFFNRNTRIYGGYSNHCTICLSASWRHKHGKIIDNTIIEAQHRQAHVQQLLFTKGQRQCTTCKQTKSIEVDFPHRLLKWARFKDDCKNCAHEKELRSKTSKARQGASYRQRWKIRRWAIKFLQNHIRRGFETAVEINDIIKLVDSEGDGICYYTGDLVKIGCGASVDVKNPAGKCEINNLCLCSHACNSTKSSMTELEFKEYLRANPEILNRIHKNNEDRLKLHYVKEISLTELKDLVHRWQSSLT
jgi:hypothetical protein